MGPLGGLEGSQGLHEPSSPVAIGPYRFHDGPFVPRVGASALTRRSARSLVFLWPESGHPLVIFEGTGR